MLDGSQDSTAELLDIYMGRLEQQLDRSEDTFRLVSTFLLLLQNFPGDMEPVFQRDVAVFFTVQIPNLDTLRYILLAFIRSICTCVWLPYVT